MVKRDPLLFMETPRALDPHRTVDAGTIMIFLERTVTQFVGTVGFPSDGRPRGSVISRSGPRVSYLISMWRLGTLVEEIHDRSAIEPRSHRDRAAIVLLHRGISATIPPLDQTAIDWESGSRSTHYCGPIATWSCFFWSKIEADSSWDWSHDHRQMETAPTMHPIRSHDRINRPWFLGQISLSKACIIPYCSSTLDWIVEELNNSKERSWVLCNSPAFRLNCEAIEAGWIASSSLISSSFPHDFRTSTRKNPSKFPSIHANSSLILVAIGLVVRFDRLLGGNLSFD